MNKEIIREIMGSPGRLINMSKGRYRYENPRNLVVFNSNIFTQSGKKIWYGDIDVTTNEQDLIDLNKVINEKIYLLYEMDGRFENEKTPKIEKAVVSVDNGVVTLNDNLTEYFTKENGQFLAVEREEEPEPELPDHKNIHRDYNFDTKEYEEIPYTEKDYDAFKMPLSKFKSKNKTTPVDKLYNFFTTKCYDPKKRPNLNIMDFYISNDDEEKFREIVGQWLIDYYGLEKGDYEYSKNMGWLCLELPSTFRDSKYGPTWAKKG